MNMGSSESVYSHDEGRGASAIKQGTIEKIPKYASAEELGIFTENNHEKMFISNQTDVAKVTCVNSHSGNFDLTRSKDVSEDLNCDNDVSSTHPTSQASSNPEKTTSKDAVVDRLYHSIGDWYPEHTDEIVRILLAMETNSLSSLMEQPRPLKEKVDEMMADRIVARIIKEGSQNTLQSEGQQLDPAKREELGEQLYETISKWHPAKADEIVGMFLELSYEDLNILARDTTVLQQKVQEALGVLESSQAGSSQSNIKSDVVERELLGDQVHEMVAKLYPDQADKVTGMLLEMDVKDLLVLVQREELLSEKAQQAYNALSSVTEEFSPKPQPSFDFQEKGEELYKAVEKVHPECADKITGMLLEMDWKCLDNLVKNPSLLKERIEEAFIVLENTLDASETVLLEENEKQTIGEQLFAAVHHLQPNNADKITGMLLEMAAEDLKALMENQQLLEEKVVQSLKVLTEDEGSAYPEDEKESLGEQLYNIIVKDFPEEADIITGMLLEMEPSCIMELLQNPELLQEKVQAALNVVLHEGQTR